MLDLDTLARCKLYTYHREGVPTAGSIAFPGPIVGFHLAYAKLSSTGNAMRLTLDASGVAGTEGMELGSGYGIPDGTPRFVLAPGVTGLAYEGSGLLWIGALVLLDGPTLQAPVTGL